MVGPARWLALALVLATSLFASAQVVQTVNTNATATAGYDPFTAGVGPFPFSNFGVKAGSTITPGTVTATVTGSTSFTLPSFTAGQHILAGSSFNIGYTPTWLSGTATADATVSANAGFFYDIGPFSGSDSIYNQNLYAQAGNNFLSGGNLQGSSATAYATGQNFTSTYSLSATLASASASLITGGNMTQTVSTNPTAEYGYYTWTSTDGKYSSGDTLTWNPASGGALSYQFPTPGAPNDTPFYLNFMPAVRFDVDVTPSTEFDIPVSGNLSAEALGDTLASYTFPIGTPLTETYDYQAAEFSAEFTPDSYYSVPLTFNYCDNPKAGCDYFQVDGFGFFTANTYFPSTLPTNTMNMGGSGGWDPSGTSFLPLPLACGPQGCYLSTDDTMPVGQGTVNFTSAPLSGVPEPDTYLLVLSGVLGLATQIRRRKVRFTE